MTEQPQASTPDSTQSPTGRLDPPTRRVAIGLLVIFVLAMAVMFFLRGDDHWDRMVYLFSGLEAIVFAGVGALFGTTVQRSAVSAARADADQARSDADQAQQEARAAAETAARGKALAAAIKATGNEMSASTSPEQGAVRRGARPEDQPAGAQASNVDPTVATLVRVAAELFPG